MSDDVDDLHLPLMPEPIGRTHITILSVVSLESTTQMWIRRSSDVNWVFHTEVNFGLEFFICAKWLLSLYWLSNISIPSIWWEFQIVPNTGGTQCPIIQTWSIEMSSSPFPLLAMAQVCGLESGNQILPPRTWIWNKFQRTIGRLRFSQGSNGVQECGGPDFRIVTLQPDGSYYKIIG